MYLFLFSTHLFIYACINYFIIYLQHSHLNLIVLFAFFTWFFSIYLIYLLFHIFVRSFMNLFLHSFATVLLILFDFFAPCENVI